MPTCRRSPHRSAKPAAASLLPLLQFLSSVPCAPTLPVLLQVNNYFSIFSARAKSDAFFVDGTEVSDARWFDRRELMQLWRHHGAQGVDTGYRQDLPGLSDPQERTMVSSWLLCCLDAFEAGGGVPVTEVTAHPDLELPPAGAIRLHYLAPPPPKL